MHSIDYNTTNVPTFLIKLWSLVEDASIPGCIHWSNDGKSFTIDNPSSFSQEILPRYFKHNNLASFIRQLNMYGFRKVISSDTEALRTDNDQIEFAHPCFRRGEELLLQNIKRKQANPRAQATDDNSVISNLFSDVDKVKRKTLDLEAKFDAVKKQNELLWRETVSTRHKFNKQQKLIAKLVHFLMAMVKPGNNASKRQFTHLALESGDCIGAGNSLDYDAGPLQGDLRSGPIIHEVTHVDGTNESTCLEQVFTADNGSRQAGIPKDNLPTYQQNSPETHSALPQNLCSLTTSQLPRNQSMSTLGLESDESELFPAHTSAMPSNFLVKAETAVPSVTLDYAPVVPIVQSPQGSILNQNPSSSSISQQHLVDEFLQFPDPSAIMPNIVTNSLIGSSGQNSRLNLTSKNESASKSKENQRLSPNRHTFIKMPNGKSVKLKNFTVDAGASNSDIPTLKQTSSSVASRKSPKSTSDSKGGTGQTFISAIPANSELVPADTASKEVLNDQTEEIQDYLDLLQQSMSKSNVNLDASTILSLFSNDDYYGLGPDLSISGAEGNAIETYDPLDLESVYAALDFSEVTLSPRKRQRFTSKRDPGEANEDQEAGLQTPQIQLDEPQFL